jgi:glucokinase
VLRDEGILMSSPNIAWKLVPLREMVARATGLPVFLDNDATAAAAGERLIGVAKGVDDFVLVTLGTGIGGGICSGGSILRGHRGTAAEVGHMVVDPAGPLCGCGRRGCLEALASGTALEREAVRLASKDPGSVLHEASTTDPGSVTGEDVASAAHAGDAAAAAAFENISWYLGLGIANLVHLLDPELVVLGGGVSRSGDLFIDTVRDVVASTGIPDLVRDVRIELSTLGGDAGVIGAAAIAWEGIGARSSN